MVSNFDTASKILPSDDNLVKTNIFGKNNQSHINVINLYSYCDLSLIECKLIHGSTKAPE